MNLIEKYKKEIEDGLEKAAQNYLKSFESYLSPRWFNTDGMIESVGDDGNEQWLWSIKSTQCASKFYIKVTKEDAEHYKQKDFRTIWDDFRRFRTQWLEENYPQINRF